MAAARGEKPVKGEGRLDPSLRFICECHSQKHSNTGTVDQKDSRSFSQCRSLPIGLVAMLLALWWLEVVRTYHIRVDT